MKQIKKAHEYARKFGKWQWKQFFEKENKYTFVSFVGHGIYVLGDYKAQSYLYAMQSAPWYIRNQIEKWRELSHGLHMFSTGEMENRSRRQGKTIILTS